MPGNVVLETSLGNIELELYWQHAPKDFMVQGGDPTGTGRGGTSIYGQRFEDEIHPELRFVGAGSQFFLTLAPTPFLDRKHTIFGRVESGMRVVQRLGALATDNQDRPKEEVKIYKATVKVP
ncbi:hypothetical protein Clacol_006575 [Clathrus columnatus]|uniref:peptidylprolyl isomerase n=1 Tax=Clathrus columnatus TaxID=1419009 RepID=A0AAV5AGP0_9AGAM|nr:hypothetical protein Clacol_006575 [Clathrus columnatus]